MLEEVKIFIADFFENHRMRKMGFLFGVLFGIVILVFGWWNTFFAFFCGVIGLYIGSRFDKGDDLVSKTLKLIERLLPEKIQRW